MVQRVHVTLVDDLTGEPASETVQFGLDGVEYEIDLSGDHAAALRDALKEYVHGGRRIPRQRNSNKPATKRITDIPFHRSQYPAIRDWARQHGFSVTDRGRIPNEVMQSYREAHDR